MNFSKKILMRIIREHFGRYAHALRFAMQPMQCNPCNATHAMQPMQCNPCSATHAMQPMQCSPCNVTHAVQHMQCNIYMQSRQPMQSNPCNALIYPCSALTHAVQPSQCNIYALQHMQCNLCIATLCDIQISKSQKKNSWPHPSQILGAPMIYKQISGMIMVNE